MKKLISLLCIAAVSITFSYTDVAEARVLKSGRQSSVRQLSRKNKSMDESRRKSRSHVDGNDEIDSDEADEVEQEVVKPRKKHRRKDERSKRRRYNQGIVESNAQDEMGDDEDIEEVSHKKTFKQKKNKKRHRNKSNKNKRYLNKYKGAQDEQNRNANIKRKKNKKWRRNKSKNSKWNILNTQNVNNKYNKDNLQNNDSHFMNRNGNYENRNNNYKKYNNMPIDDAGPEPNADDWRNMIALADEHGRVINPQVNGTIVTVNNEPKTEKAPRKKNVIRITKGLTPHIALGTDTKQLIQPKHNNKRNLKEPIQLRQELERYRKMFAKAPTVDETA